MFDKNTKQQIASDKIDRYQGLSIDLIKDGKVEESVLSKTLKEKRDEVI